jgi:protoheme IX farnesyltransferase
LSTTTSPQTLSTAGARGSLLRTYVELAKFRLTGLVVVTAGTGFLLASEGAVKGFVLLGVVLGTALLSGGASALNQVLEVAADARMPRTMNRPLPAGRVGMTHALLFGLLTGVAGFLLLAASGGMLAAGLGVLTFAIYVGVYTPLKRVTTLCTPVGAVVGAIPPVIGWTAAAGQIEAGAIVLAAILFVWQIPHFLAIAWLYRDDYAKGGFKMLPLGDPGGRTTFTMVLLYSLALLPVTLVAAAVCPTGWLFPLGAAVLGIGFSWLAVRLYRERTRAAARTLFLASLLYLPLLLALLVLDPTRGVFPS